MAFISSSSSSSSITTRSSIYEVFLSFRGEDTRNSFVSHLYRNLKRSGVNVFLDSKSLWTGESIGQTLLAAIQGSKISIPIFSEHYADSKWCLMELVEIVKCQNSISQLVLPIFFKVDPSNVRNQKKGSFAKAFKDHKKNFKTDIVKDWRDALKEIGDLKGEVVNNTTDQAELIESIVERVMAKLSHKTHLAESKYLTGIDSHVNELLSLLNLDSKDVQFVGISGIGGIGKTTIAKNVYNRLISIFKKHSFISDVREHATSSMGLVSLQEWLLKDIFKNDDFDIPDYYRGKTLIEERRCEEKVLIVLDDVDSVEQVDYLVGQTKWLGQGSKIIITTRDEDVLKNAKIYRLEGLNHNQSLELFSMHAFGEKLPPDNYMKFSIDMASYSGGLPLTLKVLGSLLSKADTKEWESTLQSLKEIPPEEVQLRLRISYDKLTKFYQKEIFLDAACFFIGWEKEEVISIWEACGYHPMSAIRILTERSLIKFEDEFRTGRCLLKMHDQVRDMGRGIVLEENRDDPSKRSRLWSRDDILQILESNKGTNMVKGMVLPNGFSNVYSDQHHSEIMILPNGFSNVYLDQHHFEMMSNLRFLHIAWESVNVNFLSLPWTLQWFSWEECPWKVIPTTFYHKGLVHLKLSGRSIKQTWHTKPRDENKFLKLKVLDLSGCCCLLESPNFSWFPCLKRLDLSHCWRLKNLDESIGQLRQLESLNMEICERIRELPNSIDNLKSLVELNLSGSGVPELPHSIENLKYLVEINLSETEIKELPHSIGNLESLVKLNLSKTKIKELPRSIGNLKSLVKLNLSGSGVAKLPHSIGNLKSLVELNLSETRIKELPHSIGNLKSLVKLNLSGSGVAKLPPSIGGLKNLVELDLNTSVRLGIEELPDGVGLLENLKVLKASYWSTLVKLPTSMGRMRCLHTINLIGTNISKLPDDFSMLSNLEVLKMSGNMKSFPRDLIHLKKLRILKLERCKLLEELPEVSSSLVELDCHSCSSLERIFDISRLKHLKVLHLCYCEKLKEIQGLEGAESLEDFKVDGCPNMTDRKRNVYGQGTLLSFEEESLGQEKHYRLCASSSGSKGIILCIVFRGNENWAGKKKAVFRINATIHPKDKAIKCSNLLEFEGVEYGTGRDMICLHYLKGFDWFGIPLQGKDSIATQVYAERFARLKVKFFELLFEEEDREPAGLEKSIDPARRVADFFIWDDSVSEAVVVGAEEESMSRPSKRPHLHAKDDDDDDEASVLSLDLTPLLPLTPHYVRERYDEEEKSWPRYNYDDVAPLSSLHQATRKEYEPLIIFDNQEEEEEAYEVSMPVERQVVLHRDDVDEAAGVDSGPRQHHNSTNTFLELICFPFTLLFSPCIDN